mmetsp:Transcript_2673/g.6556  ORF Transcript_2673/g.6556 Transcript_2673/m.6556 type:complete len:368 (+) Transcript_2673:1131-2234(+)
MHSLLAERDPESSAAHGLREPSPRVGQVQKQLFIFDLPPHDASKSAEDGLDHGAGGAADEVRLLQEHREVLDGRAGQAHALALLQGDRACLVDVILAGCERGPQPQRLQVVLFEPVRAGVLPLVHELAKGLGDLLGLLRRVIGEGRLCRCDLQHRAPLRVAVQLQGKLRALEPSQDIVQGLPVLLRELELQRAIAVRARAFRQHETEGVHLRVAGAVEAGACLAALSDLAVELRYDVRDDASHGAALLGNLTLDGDVEAAVDGVVQLCITPGDAQAAKEDTSATLCLHAAVVDAPTANDATEDVGSVHSFCQQIVEKDLLGPRILVLRHGRWRILGQLRSYVRLRRGPWWRRRRDRLEHSFLWRLHV